jgi:hypothetical protein
VIESKHLQETFAVNVFSIARFYMPVEISCQAFSSTFPLEGYRLWESALAVDSGGTDGVA